MQHIAGDGTCKVRPKKSDCRHENAQLMYELAADTSRLETVENDRIEPAQQELRQVRA